MKLTKFFIITFILFSLYFIFCLFLGVNLFDATKAMSTQYFGVLLPGAALNLVLLKTEQRFITFTSISYALGYMLTLLLYFLFVPWGGQAYAPYIVFFILPISMLIINAKKEKLYIKPIDNSEWIFILLFIIYIVFLFFTYSANLIAPLNLNEMGISYVQDHLYWIQNAGAATRSFPINQPRISVDAIYYYHHFTSIHIAWVSLTTSIDVFALGGVLYTLTKGILLFGAIYLISIKLSSYIWIRIISISAILFCTGIESPFVTYFAHTYLAPFGFDIGLAFAGFFIYFLIQQCECDGYPNKWFWLSLVCFITCTGSKGPIGAIMLILIGGVCFIWLLQKKYLLAFSYGISFLSIFLFITICMQGLFLLNDEDFGGLSFSEFVNEAYYNNGVSFFLESLGVPGWPLLISLPFLAIVLCFISHPVIFILFTYGVLGMVFNKQMRTPLCFGLFVSGMIGLALGIFYVAGGHSEMYFVMAAYLPCISLGIINIQMNLNRYSTKIKLALYSVLILIQFMLLLFGNNVVLGNMSTHIRKGWINILASNGIQKPISNGWFTKSDLKAMQWIRLNTPKDSIILTDTGIINWEFDRKRNHYYGAFCERQLYCELGKSDLTVAYMSGDYISLYEKRAAYIIKAYNNSNEALEKIKNDGVKYVIHTLDLTPNFNPDVSLAELVFSTNTINIYYLR